MVTGDYFIDDDIRTTLRTLGAQVKFKPLWVEELAGLVRAMLERATESKADDTCASAQAVPPPPDWAR